MTTLAVRTCGRCRNLFRNQKVDDASVKGSTTVAENVRHGQNISESGMGGKATEVTESLNKVRLLSGLIDYDTI